MNEIGSKEYLKIKEEKVCFFCHNGTHARKHKIFTHNFKQYHWVCRPCLEVKGVANVIAELEKIPFSQNETSFFKKKLSVKVTA